MRSVLIIDNRLLSDKDKLMKIFCSFGSSTMFRTDADSWSSTLAFLIVSLDISACSNFDFIHGSWINSHIFVHEALEQNWNNS